MKTTSLHYYDYPKELYVVVFLVAMLSISTNSANAMATDLVPQNFRVSVAADNVKNTWQYAVAYQLRPPRRLRARHLELAIGAIATTSQTHAFVSFGPVWQRRSIAATSAAPSTSPHPLLWALRSASGARCPSPCASNIRRMAASTVPTPAWTWSD
jgi:hypothetical protein